MKKDTKKILTGVGGILLVLGLLMYFGVIDVSKGSNAPKALDVAGNTQTQSQQQQLAGTCTVPLSTAQTMNIAGFDADKPSTAVSGIATVVFTDATNGKILPGNTTTPGGAYSVLASKSGSLKGYIPSYQTSCSEAQP